MRFWERLFNPVEDEPEVCEACGRGGWNGRLASHWPHWPAWSEPRWLCRRVRVLTPCGAVEGRLRGVRRGGLVLLRPSGQAVWVPLRSVCSVEKARRKKRRRRRRRCGRRTG